MPVSRICHRDVDVVRLDDSIRTAAQRMLQRNVGSLVVVGEDRRPAGVLTDRDLVLRVLAEGLPPETVSIPLVMSPEPICVREDASVEEALSHMRRGSCRRLPVVDAGGALVGMVTLDDVLHLMAKQLKHVSALIEEESPDAVADE